MKRDHITHAAGTPSAARLELSTGETITLTGDHDAALSLERPFVLVFTQDNAPRVLNVPPALLVTVAQVLGVHAPELTTPDGQAALMAQGVPGPYPVPAGVTLGGYAHGTALTEHEALRLASLPAFPDHWLILPSEAGGAPFTLLWGNAASGEELDRASDWATMTAASLKASSTPRGTA